MSWLMAIVFVQTIAPPAASQAPQVPPMQFRAIGWCDDSNLLIAPKPTQPLTMCPAQFVRYTIFADGPIRPSTAGDFERFLSAPRHGQMGPGTDIYLNSRGGDVDAGLKFGRLIRARQFSTRVGKAMIGAGLTVRPSAAPGLCASSCTLIFLGGTERYFTSGQFGVHRMSFTSDDPDYHPDYAQKKSAELLAYVREMGVDPAFINDMMATGRESREHSDMHGRYSLMTPARMIALNVVTASPARWEPYIDPKSGNWSIRGEWLRPGAFKTMEFVCQQSQSAGRKISVRARGTLRVLAKNDSTLVRINFANFHAHGVGSRREEIKVSNSISGPSVADGVAEVEFWLTAGVADMLQTANRIVVEFDLPAPPSPNRVRRYETYQVDMDFASGRDRVKSLIANCR
jgi:hypothetical protein